MNTTAAPPPPSSRAARHFASRPPASFNFEEILYAKAEGVARITINRPQAYNAYSTAALEELAAAFRDATFDDAIGVVVLTGAGDRAFCTGGDVKEYAEAYVGTPRDYWKYMALFRAYIESILNTGKPVIARINGMAVGGGNESQLACDLAVMAQHAALKQVGTHVGSVACGGATQWLPIAVGDRRAREMLFLNESIPAGQALAWGLVNRVAPSVRRGDTWVETATQDEIALAQKGRDGYRIDLSRLDSMVDDLARALLASFPECARYTKQQTNFWKDLAWHQTVRHAQDWLSLHYACWEPVEGMRAFTEKRPARYALLRERAAQGESSEAPWGAPVRDCRSCGATNLPAAHTHCGLCGTPLS
jgi:6-oxocyclohex-1-ene-1-carbonyl-CoA hydrolase